MFDIALAQPWGSPELFGCFAFRSYPQAEEKANEFGEQHPECNRVAVIKSFHSIYREFCEQEDEQPIDRVDAAESTLSSYLTEIRMQQPKVFDLLEGYRTTFWAENKFSTGATTLFATHAIIQSWHENHFTRLWHHPKFDPENPDPQRELRNSFVIAEVVFDELEIDEFLDILPMAVGNLPKVETFDHFDRLMRLKLDEFDEVKVDFDQIPFGHGQETNLYKRQNGRSYHLGIREWPFGNFRIGFLTTEMLTSGVVEKVFEKDVPRVRAKVRRLSEA